MADRRGNEGGVGERGVVASERKVAAVLALNALFFCFNLTFSKKKYIKLQCFVQALCLNGYQRHTV